MERESVTIPVPIPLVAAVLLMLVALVIVKVRAARVRGARGEPVRSVMPRGPSRRDLPADPAAALESLKRSGSRRDG